MFPASAPRLAVCLGALLLGGTLFSGCNSSSGKYVPVTGKFTVKGQPYDPATQEDVMLIMYPTSGSSETTYVAVNEPDGSFTVPGVEQQGVPPGKYKISLERTSDNRKQPVVVAPALKGRQSTLEKEILPGNGDLGTIELTQAP